MLSSQPYGAVNGAASRKDEILRITLIRDWKSCHLPSTPVCLTKHFPMCTPFGVALFPAFPSPSRTPTICFGFRTTQPDHELMNTALFLRLNIAHKRLQTRKKSKIRLITFCASRICCALNPLKGISLKDKQLGDQKRKIEKKDARMHVHIKELFPFPIRIVVQRKKLSIANCFRPQQKATRF